MTRGHIDPVVRSCVATSRTVWRQECLWRDGADPRTRRNLIRRGSRRTDAYLQFIDGSHIRATIAALLAYLTRACHPCRGHGDSQPNPPLHLASAPCPDKLPRLRRALSGRVRTRCRRGALERNCRRSSRCQLCRTAGDVSQHTWRKRPDDRLRRCYASLFTDRAISYPKDQGVRPHEGCLDRCSGNGALLLWRLGSCSLFRTESGFDKVVLINAAWGGRKRRPGHGRSRRVHGLQAASLRTPLVPIVEKVRGEKSMKMIYATGEHPTRRRPTSRASVPAFVLGDSEILTLARWAVAIEAHYGCPMDMEWARDGENGRMYIVQAPTVVQSRRCGAAPHPIGSQGRQGSHGCTADGDAVGEKPCPPLRSDRCGAAPRHGVTAPSRASLAQCTSVHSRRRGPIPCPSGSRNALRLLRPSQRASGFRCR